MKSDNLFIGSCLLVVFYIHLLVCLFVFFALCFFGCCPFCLGSSQFPTCFWCVKHWLVVDRYMRWRWLVTKCLCSMSLPLVCSILCERDSVCQMWHFLSSLLHLFSGPDSAAEHTYWTAGHTVVDKVQLCRWTTVHETPSAEKTAQPVCR